MNLILQENKNPCEKFLYIPELLAELVVAPAAVPSLPARQDVQGVALVASLEAGTDRGVTLTYFNTLTLLLSMLKF